MEVNSMKNLGIAEQGGVLRVTLDRPERRNAMNLGMFEELRSVFETAAGDASVRVVVLRGAGGHFCSGGDLAPADAPEDDSPLYDRALRVLEGRVLPMARAFHALPQPTIAVVDGIASGAGANLALGCDFVLASEKARFCEIFVRRALSLDCAGTWLLPRLVGLRRAKELALLGEWIDAAEALDLGLVNRVVPGAELSELLDAFCKKLLARAPGALARIKRSLDESFEAGFDEALVKEAEDQAGCTTSPDFAEAMAAFLEKREPRFA